MSFAERLAQHRASLSRDYVAAVEAERFVAMMEAKHPAELAEWLRANAVRFCTVALGNMARSDRAKANHRVGARAFADAMDEESLSVFRSVEYVIDADNTRRFVADMTGRDHRFVADGYEASGKRDLMLAAFHRAVAKKVGAHRTADVLSEDQYESMLRSFLDPKPRPESRAA